MNEVSFGSAQAQDEGRIRELLDAAGLPGEDIGPHMPQFILAHNGNGLVGCVALELAGGSALLRSLAVVPEYRSKGLGRELCRRITETARTLGYRELYLLTTTAADYFRKQGYEQIERTVAPDGIRATEQFRSLCPSTATLMRRAI